MSLNHSPAIVTDGLVLCLDAANARSYPGTGTTWTDLKKSNNATLTNGLTFDAENAGSILFDGTDDYVNLNIGHLGAFLNPSNPSVYPEFSMFAWAKTDIVARRQVFGDWNTNGSNQTCAIEFGGYSQPDSSINVLVGGGIPYVRLLDSYELDTWYYLGFTFDGSYCYGYLNSQYKGSAGVGVQRTTDSQSSRLGTPGAVSTSNTFSGHISNFSIYHKQLTADEVRQNYEATVGRYT